MSNSLGSRGQPSARGSLLDLVPTTDEIRRRLTTNAVESRILRSLYRVARRIENHKDQASEDGQGGGDAND